MQNCGECVTSVEGGVVGNAGFEEILATTYTGIHIFLFTLKDEYMLYSSSRFLL